jgi:hypothetical protein
MIGFRCPNPGVCVLPYWGIVGACMSCGVLWSRLKKAEVKVKELEGVLDKVSQLPDRWERLGDEPCEFHVSELRLMLNPKDKPGNF